MLRIMYNITTLNYRFKKCISASVHRIKKNHVKVIQPRCTRRRTHRRRYGRRYGHNQLINYPGARLLFVHTFNFQSSFHNSLIVLILYRFRTRANVLVKFSTTSYSTPEECYSISVHRKRSQAGSGRGYHPHSLGVANRIHPPHHWQHIRCDISINESAISTMM